MKKLRKFISFPFVLFAFFAGTMEMNALNKPNLLSGDYCTLTMKFFTADTIVVVSPDTCALSVTDRCDIESYVNWGNGHYKPVYVYKNELAVSDADRKKHMLFFGCLTKFQKKEFIGIPVRKQANGFRYENRNFNHPDDAFFYINKKANRMYLCKNSDQSHHQFFAVGGTGYPLHIFRGNEIVLTGVYQ